MEPGIQGRVWMSSLPINFTSPNGLVVPFGQPGAQSILTWTPGFEPRQVMHGSCQQPPAQHPPVQVPLARDRSAQVFQWEAFPGQFVPVQPPPSHPLQGYPVPGQLPNARPLPDQPFLLPQQQQFSAETPQQKPHIANNQQFAQGTVLVEIPVQHQADSITPPSLYSDYNANEVHDCQIDH